MRYLSLITIFLFLLMAETGFAQKFQDLTVSQVPNHAISDSSYKLPTMGNFNSPVAVNEIVEYGMPIYNPQKFDAKMKYWWPSVDYDYNMPNPYHNNWDTFDIQKEDKED